MSPSLRTIAIVGGGFSGTVLATRLLQHPPPAPVRIVLLERNGQVGRGVAYARRDHDYLLNVPAGRMSSDPGDAHAFLRYAQRRRPDATAEDFLPRWWYGEHLEELLVAAQLMSPAGVRLDVVHSNVTAVRRPRRDATLRLELDRGELLADDVVLAVGNTQPARLAPLSRIERHPGYVADPWKLPAEFRADERVLLIGTGLTMIDVATAAFERAHAPAVMHALSRHGLVPPSQTEFRPDASSTDGAAALLAAAPSARRIVRLVRTLAREAEQAGGDWREAITFVRRVAPALWQRLPTAERRRFLRHTRVHWDTHRHRVPAETLRRVDALCRAGRLKVTAGRILDATSRGDAIDLTLRRRGATGSEMLIVDRVINCTGPDFDLRRAEDPLWRNLLGDGLAVPDELGLGLRTGPDGGVFDAEGWPGPRLYYLGPMLRADHWEATAALELGAHAERLAARLQRDDR